MIPVWSKRMFHFGKKSLLEDEHVFAKLVERCFFLAAEWVRQQRFGAEECLPIHETTKW